MSLYHDVLDTIAAVGVGAGLPIAAAAALQAIRSARTANAQLKAEHRPFLLHVPYTRYEDGPRSVDVIPGGSVQVSGEGDAFVDLAKGKIVVQIRNVGRGVARIATWRLVVPGHPEEGILGGAWLSP